MRAPYSPPRTRFVTASLMWAIARSVANSVALAVKSTSSLSVARPSRSRDNSARRSSALMVSCPSNKDTTARASTIFQAACVSPIPSKAFFCRSKNAAARSSGVLANSSSSDSVFAPLSIGEARHLRQWWGGGAIRNLPEPNCRAGLSRVVRPAPSRGAA